MPSRLVVLLVGFALLAAPLGADAQPDWIPTKFDLVINPRTATGLGPTIPQSLLIRADEAIQ